MVDRFMASLYSGHMNSTATVYVTRTQSEQWHQAQATSKGAPKGTALCGIKRIAQRAGELPTWADCRMRNPQNLGDVVCPDCFGA